MFKKFLSLFCKKTAGVFTPDRPKPTAVCGPVSQELAYSRWVGIENPQGVPICGYAFTMTMSEMLSRTTRQVQDVLMQFDEDTIGFPKIARQACTVDKPTPAIMVLLNTVRRTMSTRYNLQVFDLRESGTAFGTMALFYHPVDPTMVFLFGTEYATPEKVIELLERAGHAPKERLARVDAVVEAAKTEVTRPAFKPQHVARKAQQPSPAADIHRHRHRNDDTVNHLLMQQNINHTVASCRDDDVAHRRAPEYHAPSHRSYDDTPSRCDDTPARHDPTPSRSDDTPSWSSSSDSGCGGSYD